MTRSVATYIVLMHSGYPGVAITRSANRQTGAKVQ